MQASTCPTCHVVCACLHAYHRHAWYEFAPLAAKRNARKRSRPSIRGSLIARCAVRGTSFFGPARGHLLRRMLPVFATAVSSSTQLLPPSVGTRETVDDSDLLSSNLPFDRFNFFTRRREIDADAPTNSFDLLPLLAESLIGEGVQEAHLTFRILSWRLSSSRKLRHSDRDSL